MRFTQRGHGRRSRSRGVSRGRTYPWRGCHGKKATPEARRAAPLRVPQAARTRPPTEVPRSFPRAHLTVAGMPRPKRRRQRCARAALFLVRSCQRQRSGATERRCTATRGPWLAMFDLSSAVFGPSLAVFDRYSTGTRRYLPVLTGTHRYTAPLGSTRLRSTRFDSVPLRSARGQPEVRRGGGREPGNVQPPGGLGGCRHRR